MKALPCRLRRRTFLGLALVSPWAANSIVKAAAETSPEDIKELLAKVRDESGLPAIAAGVMKGGVALATGAVGLRKIGSPAPVTIADKFHLGSCTKAMTATLIAMFVEQGELQWNKTLAEIFPERAAKMDPAYRAVTLQLLLTHRSGTRANASGYGSPAQPLIAQRLSYLDSVVADAPEFEPDNRFSYSNAGHIILGAVLERVSGKQWEVLMKERLFTPLGMSSAGFGAPSKPNQTDQPWGHVMKEGKFVPRYGDNPPGLGPAGTVHCNMLDYLKFADLHASGGKRKPGLLRAELFNHLHTPPPGATYAMGWGTGKRVWAHGAVLTHAGSNTMNYFIVWIAPEIDLSIAVASNAAGEKVPEILDKVVAELVRKFA